MRGFVLAAGYGTRLRPITDHVPKALVPVAGKPLLARSLEFLKNNGITVIGANSHYLSNQLEEFRKHSEIPFELFHEEKIRGTGGALLFAKEFLASEESFFIINVDIVCKFDLRGIIEEFSRSSNICTLIAFPSDGKGTILYDSQTGKYRGTPAEPVDGAAFPGADFIGAALYKREFLSLLTEDDFSIVPVWGRAVKTGLDVSVHIVKDGFWRDIGKPQALADIHFDILDRKIELDIPGTFSINYKNKSCFLNTAPAHVSDSLGSYSWVESNDIEAGCTICESVVFDNSHITSGQEVNTSLVTPWGVIKLHE